MASPKHAIPVSPILGANENLQADLVRAILSGYDATAAQGARIAVLAAKNANSSPDFDQDLTGLLTNARLAVHDGTNWGRLRGGIDNAVAAGNLRGAYVGGVVTDPVGVFANGDVSLLHFDVNGRLLTTAVAVIPPGTFAQGDFDSIAANEAIVTALWVRSAVTGYDASAAVGSRNVPVVARNFDAITDVDADLIGLLTNSRLAFYNGDINKWERLEGRAALAAQPYGLGRILTDSVVRGDDGATYSAVAARAAGAAHSEALIHLLSSACVYGYDASLGVGVRDVPIGTDLASAISGRLATAFRGLNTDSLTCGIDNTVAAPNNVVRPVEARNFDADADVDAALVGLLTSTRNSLYRLQSNTWNRVQGDQVSAISGLAATGIVAAYSASVAFGLDNTAAAVLRPVEARLVNLTSIPATAYGLVTLSEIYARDVATSIPAYVASDTPSLVSGRATNSLYALYTNALVAGQDTTGAAVLRPVEARAGSVAIADTVIRLFSASSLYAFDGTNQRRLNANFYASVGANTEEIAPGLNVYQARADEFAAARRGKRFYGTHQTPGTLITAQTAFVATTPTLMYRINSAAVRAIIRSLDISIANTPGGLVYVTVAIDTADRYDSAGTAITLQNSNEESVTAAVGLHYFNPTANAAGAGTRYLGTWVVPATAGANISLDLADSVLLGPTASTLLVYIWSATTAPQLVHALDLEEVS